jgi:hypothetical protein
MSNDWCIKHLKISISAFAIFAAIAMGILGAVVFKNISGHEVRRPCSMAMITDIHGKQHSVCVR